MIQEHSGTKMGFSGDMHLVKKKQGDSAQVHGPSNNIDNDNIIAKTPIKSYQYRHKSSMYS